MLFCIQIGSLAFLQRVNTNPHQILGTVIVTLEKGKIKKLFYIHLGTTDFCISGLHFPFLNQGVHSV